MIELRAVRKSYPGHNRHGTVTALDTINLTVHADESVSILGPSGCGKTTVLKVIMGLIPADSGEVLINGRIVSGPGPDRAMVFQNFALLPWADVITNVAFGLELRGFTKSECNRRARDWIGAVGLAGFEHHYPRQLSGGMQQRVGLARALAVDPAILLMDEPFGAVDAQTRRLLQEDLMALLAHRRKTVLFVTHSMEEAVLLGDRIVVMTPRPSRVHEVVEVKLPRPRPPDVEKDRRFVELKEYLWQQLRSMQRIDGR